MSYLVMECHPGYAVLLDEEGRFFKSDQQRYRGDCSLFSAVFRTWLLSKLYPALLLHLFDHQPGGADGSEPAGNGCRADRDQ